MGCWPEWDGLHAARCEVNMIYTDMTKRALNLCFEAHKEQRDKSGMPYVFHPFHLAEQMRDEDTTIVALLHDVIEDTSYTIADLAEMGFHERVCAAIELMTHDPQIPYPVYIERIKANPIAKAVKLADLRHNSDMSRLDVITSKDAERVKKYFMAIEMLEKEEQTEEGINDKAAQNKRRLYAI